MSLYYCAGSVVVHSTPARTVSGTNTQWTSFVQAGDSITVSVSGSSANTYVVSAVNNDSSLLLSSTPAQYGTGTYYYIDVLPSAATFPATPLCVSAVSILSGLFCSGSGNPAQVIAAGYSSEGDGGGGSFYWNSGISTGIKAVLLTSGGLGYSTTSSPYPLSITQSSGSTLVGTGASATATVSGFVTSVTVNSAGSGFTGVPNVSIALPSSGASSSYAATAQAILGVIGVTVTNPGSNYTSSASVAIAPPGAGQGTPAYASVTISGGSVTAIGVTSGGGGFTGVPAVTFSDPSGTGASATAVLGVVAIPVTGRGSDYSTGSAAPSVTISGGSPTASASATAVVQGIVQSVGSVTAAGSGYFPPSSANPVVVALPSSAGMPTSAAAFQAVTVADGGSSIFPAITGVTIAGGWSRLND